MARMLPEIAIRTGQGKTRTLRLDKDRYVLGRLTTNDLSFPEDSGLSRQHLAIERAGEGWTVADLGSMNGTFVNGSKLNQKRRLESGDRIEASQVAMTFMSGAPATMMARDTPVPMPSHTVVFKAAAPDTAAEPSLRTNLEEALQQQADPNAAAAPRSGLTAAAALARAGRELAAKRPLNELFAAILDLAIETVGADRGVLLTGDDDCLTVQASRGEGFRISTTVRDTVIREKASLLVNDTSQDAALREQKSIVLQQVRTLMAVPLQTDERVLGLLYLDTPFTARQWTAEDLNLVTVMANVAAIRLERERLAQAEESRRRLDAELQQAADIQRRFLPSGAPVIAGLDVAGYNVPSRSVGGDYYDFLSCSDGRRGFLLADVAGKGMPAALMMMNLQARAQVLAEAISEPSLFVTRLNRVISQNCPDNRFITLFYCAVEPETGVMSYANAGHNPPFIVRADGTIEWLKGGGPVLGILPKLEFSEYPATLIEGDVLVVYSDGVSEAVSPEGEEYGEERFSQLIQENRHERASEIVARVTETLTDWGKGAPAVDDITVLVVRRTAV